MKKLYLLIALFLCASIVGAQGIYQIWGTSGTGGQDYMGSIFNTSASADNFQNRFQLINDDPGASPQHTVPVEYNGKLYGMTCFGGNGNGVIFEWNPAANVYTKKFELDGTNGNYPYGSLVLKDNKFYGMTYSGGANDLGVIFEWDPASNVYTKKIDLDGINGSYPQGSLAVSGGKLYGMTSGGGTDDLGVIFEWDPATNIYTKKIDLTSVNGCVPMGSLVLKEGKFYGLTSQGGLNDAGVIFRWDPSTNVYTKKIDLTSTDGSTPRGNLTVYGSKLVGMTWQGGSNNVGVIFEWDPSSNVYTKKIDLSIANGGSPFGSLSRSGTKFYGMTRRGGSNDRGALFEWDPVTNTYTKKVDLSNANGCFPRSGLVLSGNKFYGMTWQGGSKDKGVLFEWDPNANLYTKKIDLQVPFNGHNFAGTLTRYNSKFYGMTSQGGNNDMGVIFEFDPATNTYTKRMDFSLTEGSRPHGSLVFLGGKFYGMAEKGGSNNLGVIFEWDPATNTYTKKVDFDGANGSLPYGNFTLTNGKLYGMTVRGGVNDEGVIFEWDPDGNVFTKKIDLNSANGSYPRGGLVLKDGKFYGTTEFGGINNMGVLFEWEPVGNVYSKKVDFDGLGGSNPISNLTHANGKFYGVTNTGGINNEGALFEWDPITNNFSKRYDFTLADGKYPQGSLSWSGDKFYGMTQVGGANDRGVIFEWDPASNVYTKKREFVQADGNGPGNGNDLILAPAPVATGMPNACVSFPPVTINNANANTWVAILDNDGAAVAEIKANGNILGVVNASMYMNNGTVREDGSHRLYLDRNITITPEFPATSPVDIRLYIRNAEFQSLKNAVNTNGQASGLNNIGDLGIFSNIDMCSGMVQNTANPVSTVTTAWESDYVLSTSVTRFSSFYFANMAQAGPLPLTGLEFTGRLLNNTTLLSWKTTDDLSTNSFDLERSIDGSGYRAITNVAAFNHSGVQTYSYTDKNVLALNAPVVYYRLKQKNRDGRFYYSQVIALSIDTKHTVLFYPNPVIDKANLSIRANGTETVQARIVDNSGRVVKEQLYNLVNGSNAFSLDLSELANGVYYLELKGAVLNERKKIIKQ